MAGGLSKERDSARKFRMLMHNVREDLNDQLKLKQLQSQIQ